MMDSIFRIDIMKCMWEKITFSEHLFYNNTLKENVTALCNLKITRFVFCTQVLRWKWFHAYSAS
jgi:hypothetical protein